MQRTGATALIRYFQKPGLHSKNSQIQETLKTRWNIEKSLCTK